MLDNQTKSHIVIIIIISLIKHLFSESSFYIDDGGLFYNSQLVVSTFFSFRFTLIHASIYEPMIDSITIWWWCLISLSHVRDYSEIKQTIFCCCRLMLAILKSKRRRNSSDAEVWQEEREWIWCLENINFYYYILNVYERKYRLLQFVLVFGNFLFLFFKPIK